MALLDDNKANILFKHYLGAGSTRLSREFFEEAVKSSFVVKPEQLWMYSDELPNGNVEHDKKLDISVEQVKNLQNGQTASWQKTEDERIQLIRFQKDQPCQKIDNGTLNSFKILASHPTETGENEYVEAKNIIPFNFAEISSDYPDLYNYKLTTNTGVEIPFGVGDWVVDTYSGVLTFYGDLPEGVDVNNPPLISYYEYIGGNGFRQDEKNFEGIILPIHEVTFSNSCVVTNTQEIAQKIVESADTIQKDFVKTYKWDGHDKGEGIALSFEKEIPLLYPNSHDIVKGLDEATDCELRTVLSGKTTDNSKILFVSNNTPVGQYHISENEIVAIIDKFGEDVPRKSKPIKLYLDEEHLYYVIISVPKDKSTLSDIDFNVTSTTDILGQEQVNCAVVFWDKSLSEYWPYVIKEDTGYTTGFPLVTLHGKVPPSIVMDMGLLTHDEDSITPDYYGPRIAKLILAAEDTKNKKSADFICKKENFFYLNDIIEKATKDEKFSPNNSKIILREGTYYVDGELSPVNFIVEGEGEVTIENIADAPVTINAAKDNFGIFYNLQFKDELLLNGEGDITLNYCRANTLNAESTNKIEIFNSEFKNVTKTIASEDIFILDNTDVTDTLKLDNVANGVVTSSNLNVVKVNEATPEQEGKILFDGNNIVNLSNMSETIYLYSNYIENFPEDVENLPDYLSKSRDEEEVNTTGRFPIYDKQNANRMRYAEIENPLKYFNTKNQKIEDEELQDINEYYKDDKKHLSDFIDLDSEINYSSTAPILRLLRDHTLQQRSDGRLYTWVNPTEIYISPDTTYDINPTARENPETAENPQKVENKPFSEGGSLKTKEGLSTLDDVLKRLFFNKADLNAQGKIPLQQIPDAIASSGLTFVGDWKTFADKDKDKRIYPSFADVQDKLLETEVGRLQRGWFFIVAPGSGKIYEETVETWENNPVHPQYSIRYYDKGISDAEKAKYTFTAGDWLIWEGDPEYATENTTKDPETEKEKEVAQSGRGWVKIDRAYLDPIYTDLPSVVRGHDWYWKDDKWDLGGAINFSEGRDGHANTLLDALYMINRALYKLYPERGNNINNMEVDINKNDLPFFRYTTPDNPEPQNYYYYDKATFDEKKPTLIATLKAKDDDYNTDKTSHNTFYFGDEGDGKVLTTVDTNPSNSVSYNVSVDNENDQLLDENENLKVKVLKPVDTYNDQDVGKNKWKSSNLIAKFTAGQNNTIKFTVDTVGLRKHTLEGEIEKTRDNRYSGSTTGNLTLPAFTPVDIATADNIDVSPFENFYTESTASGDVINLIKDEARELNGFAIDKLKFEGLYKDSMIPSCDILCAIQVILKTNGAEIPISKEKHIYPKDVQKDTSSSIQVTDIRMEFDDNFFASLPLPHGIMALKVTKLRLYRAVANDIIKDRAEVHFSHAVPENRVTCGRLIECPHYSPTYVINVSTFGCPWKSKSFLTQYNTTESPLQRVSRHDSVEGEVAEYRVPSGIVKNEMGTEQSYSNIHPEKINDVNYYSACFKLTDAPVTEASGFTFEIEVAHDYREYYKYNTLSAATDNIILQCCLVDDESGIVTPWFDCNSPNNGVVAPVGFKDPAMYAAHSSEFIKRVTFGRRVYSGNIYVRIGIPANSEPMSFKDIKLIEVI